MPFSALKPCAYPGCPSLVRAGYCDAHAHTEQRRVNDTELDATSKRLYNSSRWQRLRRLQLFTHPWCAECMKQNIYTVATDVDHIEPHRGDVQKFYKGPFQSLCHACHSRKTAQEVLNV